MESFDASGQDNIDRWRVVFDSDNPLAEHWPGKDDMLRKSSGGMCGDVLSPRGLAY